MSQTELNSRWMILTLAGMNLATVMFQWRIHSTIQAVKADVHTVEQATNHLTDALVLSTGKEQHAAGVVEGKLEQKAETNTKKP